MLTFNGAISQARGVAGSGAHIVRSMEKAEGVRTAIVEVYLRSKHKAAAGANQLGTWRAKLLELGWAEADDGSLWMQVDPDVPYQEPAEAAPLNPLGQLIVDIAEISYRIPRDERDTALWARLLDEAKALGWSP